MDGGLFLPLVCLYFVPIFLFVHIYHSCEQMGAIGGWKPCGFKTYCWLLIYTLLLSSCALFFGTFAFRFCILFVVAITPFKRLLRGWNGLRLETLEEVLCGHVSKTLRKDTNGIPWNLTVRMGVSLTYYMHSNHVTCSTLLRLYCLIGI